MEKEFRWLAGLKDRADDTMDGLVTRWSKKGERACRAQQQLQITQHIAACPWLARCFTMFLTHLARHLSSFHSGVWGEGREGNRLAGGLEVTPTFDTKKNLIQYTATHTLVCKANTGGSYREDKHRD